MTIITLLHILSWIQELHICKDWHIPRFGNDRALEPEPGNPKDKKIIS